MSFKLDHFTLSAKGIHRERNQDSFLVAEKHDYSLFMIFDGVSSNKFSCHFIEEYKKAVKSAINDLQNFKDSISDILFEINNNLSKIDIDGQSTISTLLFDHNRNEVKFINIGDSRIYIYSNQFLEQITNDDSLVGNENILTKCLGIGSLSPSDFKIRNADIANNYLLCTDGFYRLMESNLKEYFEILNFKKISNSKKKLEEIQKGKNNDDSTIILIRNEISK